MVAVFRVEMALQSGGGANKFNELIWEKNLSVCKALQDGRLRAPYSV